MVNAFVIRNKFLPTGIIYRLYGMYESTYGVNLPYNCISGSVSKHMDSDPHIKQYGFHDDCNKYLGTKPYITALHSVFKPIIYLHNNKKNVLIL